MYLHLLQKCFNEVCVLLKNKERDYLNSLMVNMYLKPNQRPSFCLKTNFKWELTSSYLVYDKIYLLS